MDNIEQQNHGKSRAETIKQARESCNRNLSPAAKNSNKSTVKSSYIYNKADTLESREKNIFPLKSFVIRIVCAFAIFVAVQTISSFDIKNDTNYSNNIETLITSNVTVEKAEEFIVSLLDKIK